MKKIISLFMAFVMIFTLALQSSASIGEDYTGWARSRSTGNRFYFQNGIRVTGVHVIGGTRHVFDEKGVWLLGRTNAKERFSVIFENNYNVNLENGKISFEIKNNNFGIRNNDPKGQHLWDFAADRDVSLFVNKDGKWRRIPYIQEQFDDSLMVQTGDGVIIRFSIPFSDFNYDLEPGLYRVRTQASNGERDKDGKTIWTDVRGEFNLR